MTVAADLAADGGDSGGDSGQTVARARRVGDPPSAPRPAGPAGPAGPADRSSGLEHLTTREREVLELVANGLNGDQVGDVLGISANTVRTHLQNLMRKLGVRSRLEAVSLAHRAGLVGLAPANRSGRRRGPDSTRPAGALADPTAVAGLLQDVIQRRREHAAVYDRWSTLSDRERQVFALLAKGYDHRRIADVLFLSPNTSRTHIQKLLAKLGVHSRVEAAALAIRYNLVDGPAQAADG